MAFLVSGKSSTNTNQSQEWLCLKVSMENKSIMLWDSSGVKESNQLYLNTMLRYLKDKFRATSLQEDADDWIAQGQLSTTLPTVHDNTMDTTAEYLLSSI